jgi:hypothetical protein
MRPLSMGLVLLLGGTAAAALGLAPQYHNFGKVVAGNQKSRSFTTTLPPGAPPGTTLTYTITGPDASDFQWSDNNPVDPFGSSHCQAGPQGVTCTGEVLFYPRSIGPKRATLAVSDGRGSMTTATLEGEAVAALCTNRVVFCNYALHYSGVVSWSDGTSGVNVDVVNGVASCNASGESELTSGPGLVAVEFGESEDAPSPFYRITAACPTRYPPEPARPAELGHGEIGSYKQPLAMTIAQVHKGPPRLKGNDGEVSWNLCPNAQFVPAVRQGAQATVGPHDPCPDPARRAP